MSEENNLYSPSVESAILSSAMFDEDSANKIVMLLSEEDFFIPAHREIYKIIKSLIKEGLPVDESFISPRLSKVIKNHEVILVDVMASSPITAIDPYVKLLKEYTQKRKLHDLSMKIRKSIESGSTIIDSIVDVEKAIEDIQMSIGIDDDTRSIGDIIDEIERDMEKAQSGEKLPYYETGYYNFDTYAGGFVENGLNVVAARPSMGKSSFLSGPIVSTLEKGNAAVLYSMEVVDKNALLRLISFKSQEPLSNLKRGMLSDYERYKRSKDFFLASDGLLDIVDRSGMTKEDLEIDIKKRLMSNNNIKLILVDHLLQMHIDPKKHGPTELGDITKMLKRIAQNFKVTVVLLSQLNRDVERRENKRPMMADLQGSGSIEQDADMIVFLYRPEYYKEKEWNSDESGEYIRPEVEDAEVIIGKNRDGPTGSVELKFKSKTASFLNSSSPTEEVYYIDDDYEKQGYKGSTKVSDDTITSEEGNIDMPLI